MEKKTINFILVTIVFLMGYSFILNKFYPQQESNPSSQPQQVIQTNVNKHDLTQENPLKSEDIEIIEEIEDLVEVETEKFLVTFSTTGGYIKSLYHKEYGELLGFQNIGYTTSLKGVKFQLSTPADGKIVLDDPQSSLKRVWYFDGYDVTMVIEGLDDSQNVVLMSNSLYANALDQRYQEFVYKEEALPPTRSHLKKVKEEIGKTNISFIGVRDRYYACVVFGGANQFDLIRNDKEILVSTPLQAGNNKIELYVGPQIKKELEKYGLDSIIYYGFFHGIGAIIFKILYAIYSVIGSWGISVIILSLFINVCLFPFTMKSTKAMKKMQEIQPEIEKLKEKYPDNPQKLQKEQVALFKKYKVNPLGGCLPMLFQLPVFFALYQVLLRFTELKGAEFLWIKDLSLPDHLFKLPFPPPVDYFNLLPLIIVGVSYMQQKLTSPNPNSQQKSTALFMTVFIGVIFYRFPSCMVLYWLIQNLLNLAYQFRLSKQKTI